jgi:dolichyl-phosphate-mannose--protein O-mannosyl transferase
MDVLGTRLIHLLDFEYKTGFHRTISFRVRRYETKRFDQVLFYENHFQKRRLGVPT